MLHRGILDALHEMMMRGAWETEEDLMREVLKTYPGNFENLYEKDALRIVVAGNKVLNSMGIPEVTIENVLPIPYPESDEYEGLKVESIGKCIDLWEEESQPKRTFRKRSGGTLPVRSFKAPPLRLKRSEDRVFAFGAGDFTMEFRADVESKISGTTTGRINSQDAMLRDYVTIPFGEKSMSLNAAAIIMEKYINNFVPPTVEYAEEVKTMTPLSNEEVETAVKSAIDKIKTISKEKGV